MRSVFVILLFILSLSTQAQLIADFTASMLEGCGSMQVIFEDKSVTNSGSIVAWNWDLGGTPSTKQNPGKIFDTPGLYTICLSVTDQNGTTAQTCKEEYIKIHKSPTANFTIDIAKGCSPHQVVYSNLSQGANINKFIWDIGGSANVVTTSNPNEAIISTYTNGGLYSATLSLEDANGCTNTLSKKDIVEVFSVPRVLLSREIIAACDLPWSIKITNENVVAGVNYEWDFGNGQKYIGTSPPITSFNEIGSYDITVYVDNGACIDTFVFEDYIDTDVQFGIESEKESACIGESITFKNLSKVGVDSMEWRLGDGSVYQGTTISHTFANAGCYDIITTRYWQGCVFIDTLDCFTVHPSPSPQFSLENQFTCEIPVDVLIREQSGGTFQWGIDTNSAENIDYDEIGNMFRVSAFGQYLVYLHYTAENGCSVKIENIEINIDKFEANLPQKGPSGCVPFNATFSDSIISNTPIMSYHWIIPKLNFTSSTKSPSLLLSDTGRYDVTLIVENSYGCKDTVARTDYLQGGVKPNVDFTVDLESGCVKDTRAFVSNAPNSNFWIWSFGPDGATSFDKDPMYTYPEPGIFDVSLTAFHNGCGNTIYKSGLITVKEPYAAYSIGYQCDDPYTITIQDAKIDVDSVYWFYSFSDGQSDTIFSPDLKEFTFPDRGKHILGLYTQLDSTGCDHTRIDTVFITDPVAAYELDTVSGCLPFRSNLSFLSIDADSFYFTLDSFVNVSQNGEIAINASGNFSTPLLTVVDIHGCEHSYQDTGRIWVNQAIALASYSPIICTPDTNVMQNLSQSKFGDITSISWYSNDTITSMEDNLALMIEEAGLYVMAIAVQDSWGCRDSFSFVFEGVSSSPDFESDTLGCTGTEIKFIPIDQSLNISVFEWDFGDGTTSNDLVGKHIYQTEGIYDVCLKISDSRGCENQICKPNHIAIANPVAHFEANPTFEECPPLLSTFTNNSSNALTYEWDFGDNSGISYVANPKHIYNEPGLFDVKLIAIRSSSCTDTFIINEYIELLGPSGAFDYKVEGNCLPLDVTFTASSDNFYQYLWDFGNGEIDSNNILINRDTIRFSYDEIGTFSPKLIITDANGCSRTFSQDLIEVNEVNIDITFPNGPYCDIPYTFQPHNSTTGSNAAITYDWIISGPQNQYEAYHANPTFEVNEYGTYDATVIAATTNCVDTVSYQDFIIIDATPLTQFQARQATLCDNGEKQLFNTSTIPFGLIDSVYWTLQGNDMYAGDTLLLDVEAGRHLVSLTTTSETGCKATITTEVIVETSPRVSLMADSIICKDEISKLIANVAMPDEIQSSIWSSGGTTLCNDCLISASVSDTSAYYHFELVAINGCSYTDSVLVTVAPVNSPSVNLIDEINICLGDTAHIIVQDYNSGYTYSWSDGIFCMDSCSRALAVPEANQYYYVTATNVYGCIGMDTTIVKVESSIDDFLVDQLTICKDSDFFLKTDGGSNPSWYIDGNLMCPSCDSILINSSKDIWVACQVYSDLGCSYTDSLLIRTLDRRLLQAGNDYQICLGETISHQSEGVGTPSWSPDNGITNSNTYTPLLSPTQSTTYYLTTIEDQCIMNDSIFVEVIYSADIEGIGDTICPGEEIYLEITGEAWKVDWYQDEHYVFSGFDKIIQPSSTTTLMAIGSRTTCINDTLLIPIVVNPQIEYQLNKDVYTSFLNSRIKIEASYNESLDYDYMWSPDTYLSCGDCPQPIIEAPDKAESYQLTIQDNETGCKETYDLKVLLNNKCSKEGFGIPNVFSPNGDGQNEHFYIDSGSREEFRSISIYNRWGSLMFKSQDPEFMWDGTFDGRRLNVGVYIYHVEAYCPDTDQDYDFTGDISVIR